VGERAGPRLRDPAGRSNCGKITTASCRWGRVAGRAGADGRLRWLAAGCPDSGGGKETPSPRLAQMLQWRPLESIIPRSGLFRFDTPAPEPDAGFALSPPAQELGPADVGHRPARSVTRGNATLLPVIPTALRMTNMRTEYDSAGIQRLSLEYGPASVFRPCRF